MTVWIAPVKMIIIFWLIWLVLSVVIFLLGRSKLPMFKLAAEIKRQIRLRTTEGGRKRFIRRQLLQGFIVWILWSVAMVVFKVYLFSWHEVVGISLILFPFYMLIYYLNGLWRWNVLAKKQ